MRKMFFEWGNRPLFEEILEFENVNFGPLYVLTSLGGPTPDLTREHYSPGALRKMGTKLCTLVHFSFGPIGGSEKNVY